MRSHRGYIKSFVLIVIAFFMLHHEGLGQVYSKIKKLSDGSIGADISPRISPKCGGFYEFLPPEYNNPLNSTKKYPLIITLHGVGEQPGFDGGDYNLDKLVDLADPNAVPPNAGAPSYYWSLAHRVARDLFPTSFAADGTNYSFIVMAPQCMYVAGPDDLEAYLNYFTSNYRIDPDRIFLTGYSHGATRTWAAMSKSSVAEKYAAIVPVAGGAEGNYRYCPTGPSVPCTNASNETSTGEDFNKVVANIASEATPKVLAIMGNADAFINNFTYNEDYVREINKANAKAGAVYYVYTPGEDPGTGHEGSWNKAHDPGRADFNGKNMYVWMLEQAAAILLPVTLTTFDARLVSKEVELDWSTASESNSSHFIIERSQNGKDFKDIGRVNASGNSSITKNYSFTDGAPLGGVSYYRLKMVDRDGSFKYSAVRKINSNASGIEFSFGPNPVTSDAWIRMSGKQKGQLQLTITDLMGRTLKTMTLTKTANEMTQNINLGGLKEGQYILAVRGENIHFTQRLIKKQ